MRKSKKLTRSKRYKRENKLNRLIRTRRQKKPVRKAGEPEGEVRFLLKKKLEESTGRYEPALVDHIMSYFPRQSVVRAIRNRREMDMVLEHMRIRKENEARAEKIIAESKERIEKIDKKLEKLTDEKQRLLKRKYDYEDQIYYGRYNFNIKF